MNPQIIGNQLFISVEKLSYQSDYNLIKLFLSNDCPLKKESNIQLLLKE
ncbi:MAG: hypothetical protein JXL97_09630 [Bacteroidales bacterium]|nr:hypothetical protein [Bacteroidales bacterium]